MHIIGLAEESSVASKAHNIQWMVRFQVSPMSHSIPTKATAAIVINESDKLNSYLFPTMTRLICCQRNTFSTWKEDPVYHILCVGQEEEIPLRGGVERRRKWF